MEDPPSEQGGGRPKRAKTVPAKVRDNLEQLAARASARASVAAGAKPKSVAPAQTPDFQLGQVVSTSSRLFGPRCYCEKELGRDWKAHRDFGEVIGLPTQDGPAKNCARLHGPWQEKDDKTVNTQGAYMYTWTSQPEPRLYKTLQKPRTSVTRRLLHVLDHINCHVRVYGGYSSCLRGKRDQDGTCLVAARSTLHPSARGRDTSTHLESASASHRGPCSSKAQACSISRSLMAAPLQRQPPAGALHLCSSKHSPPECQRQRHEHAP